MPDHGDIRFDGRQLLEPQTDIGFVFQSTNLMPWRTVLQNVLLPVEVQQVSTTEDDTQRALDFCKFLDSRGLTLSIPSIFPVVWRNASSLHAR